MDIGLAITLAGTIIGIVIGAVGIVLTYIIHKGHKENHKFFKELLSKIDEQTKRTQELIKETASETKKIIQDTAEQTRQILLKMEQNAQERHETLLKELAKERDLIIANIKETAVRKQETQ